MFANLGRALRVARETKGLSQGDLADRAKVGKSKISKYETGKELPKLDSLQRILEVLELEPYQLFYAMYRLNQGEESVSTPLDPMVQDPPSAGILPHSTEAAFQNLWSALFSTYNAVVTDRMRTVPPSDVWPKN